ncbi:helix-turn-helix transcriptional regulator [Actinoplanes aureus]|uniref:Response regulator transcription factor n=1 Tax=Actinoplanes aureus TaxID=2792083 RepID=A0A931CJJ7_9ACTN|nr:LuxR C-terminal-related transcriptional regulator [Actinoplanes aureus]MBG0566110.1 response regulator transcription factor [Actinoplanes aureus]
MPAAVLADIGGLIGCEVASYSVVDHVEQQLLQAVAVPHTSNLLGIASFHQLFDQHPGFSAYRDGKLDHGESAAWSDLLERRALRRLPLIVDFFEPRETRDQLLCVVRLHRHQGGVLAINRSRPGFSARDRAVVETLASHLRVAVLHREQVSMMRAAVRRTDRHNRRLDRASPRLDTLTARERDVVTLLTDGLGDREIAQSLHVSVRTVHKHLQNVYRKLGLDGRAQVIAMTSASVADDLI